MVRRRRVAVTVAASLLFACSGLLAVPRAAAQSNECAAATQEHPECRTKISATAQASRTIDPSSKAKGFLGPVGWLWNQVYYRVYSGNAVMMFTFGWSLFLAPVFLVFCTYAVMQGASGAFRRPTAVPPTALSAKE